MSEASKNDKHSQLRTTLEENKLKINNLYTLKANLAALSASPRDNPFSEDDNSTMGTSPQKLGKFIGESKSLEVSQIQIQKEIDELKKKNAEIENQLKKPRSQCEEKNPELIRKKLSNGNFLELSPLQTRSVFNKSRSNSGSRPLKSPKENQKISYNDPNLFGSMSVRVM